MTFSRLACSYLCRSPSTRALSRSIFRASLASIQPVFRNTPSFRQTQFLRNSSTMSDKLYISETPDEVKNAKGLHLITMNTPNGQAVQIMLEELADSYGTTWTQTLINIMTNEQKKEWFLRLDPNGRIPVLIDNNQSPPFTVHETSAEMLYLLKFADKEDKFGFKDEFERNEALQWTFFWHGSGAPYQGQVNHFSRAAPEKIPCMYHKHPHPFENALLTRIYRRHRALQERDPACLRRPRDSSVRQVHRRG